MADFHLLRINVVVRFSRLISQRKNGVIRPNSDWIICINANQFGWERVALLSFTAVITVNWINLVESQWIAAVPPAAGDNEAFAPIIRHDNGINDKWTLYVSCQLDMIWNDHQFACKNSEYKVLALQFVKVEMWMLAGVANNEIRKLLSILRFHVVRKLEKKSVYKREFGVEKRHYFHTRTVRTSMG